MKLKRNNLLDKGAGQGEGSCTPAGWKAAGKRSSQKASRKEEWWLPGAGGGWDRELLLGGYRVSVWADEKKKVLETAGGDGCRTT